MDALKLLDYDCWRVVFRKLNGEDLLSCRQVCKPFHKLVEEEEFELKWKFHLILPHLFPYFESRHAVVIILWKDLYNLRLACSSWRHSVDKYATVYKPTITPFFGMKSYPLAICLKSSEEFEEFQSKFGESNANPFPSRTVYIRPAPFEDRRNDQCPEAYKRAVERLRLAYIEKVGDFLEQFGRNIFKLQLQFEGSSAPDSLSFCKLLKRVAVYLPNLKILFLRSNQEGGEMAANWIAENALAEEMPKLHTLKFDSVNKTIEYYLLDKFAPQLTRLVRYPSENLLQQVHVEKFRNLENFVLFVVDETYNLEIFRYLKSPLKYLQLLLYPWGATERLTWNMDKFLRNIKHLPLKYLTISFHNHHHRVDLEEAGLDLEEYINENIQSLTIRFVNDDDRVSFNFLQALQKLKKLELSVPLELNSTHPTNLPEVVRLNDLIRGKGNDLPYQSNVWEKVPSLKTLIVKREHGQNPTDRHEKSTYSRQQYEMVRKNGDV